MRRLIIAAILTLPTGIARAQSAPVSFIIMNGADTVVVETFTRSASALTGDMRFVQQASRTRYVIHLRADGSPERADVTDNARGFYSGSIVFDATGAPSARSAPGAARGRLLTAPVGSHPLAGTSLALMEQLTRAKHVGAANGDSTRSTVFNIRNRIVGMATITRMSRDSLRISCDACQRLGSHQEIRVAVNGAGDITGGVSEEQEWVIVRR